MVFAPSNPLGVAIWNKFQTGLWVCAKRLKILVFLLTSSREERDMIQSSRLGVNSYIVKPVDFDQFKQSARTLGMYRLLLRTPPKAASPPVPSNR